MNNFKAQGDDSRNLSNNVKFYSTQKHQSPENIRSQD